MAGISCNWILLLPVCSLNCLWEMRWIPTFGSLHTDFSSTLNCYVNCFWESWPLWKKIGRPGVGLHEKLSQFCCLFLSCFWQFDFCHCFLTIISSSLLLTRWCPRPHTPRCVTWFVQFNDGHFFWENNKCIPMTFKKLIGKQRAVVIMCETAAGLPEKSRLLPNHW